MSEIAQTRWFNEKVLLGMTWREYVRSLFTPWDALFALILVIGIPVIIYRFTFGLASATNLTQQTPWGIWIGIDMLSGIALAAGGFTIAASVYLLGIEKYHPIVRPAVLTGFLGYLFAVFGLLCDLGSPWRLWVPMVYSFDDDVPAAAPHALDLSDGRVKVEQVQVVQGVD